MSTHKHFDTICVVVLVLSLLLTVLFMNGERLGIQVVVDEDDEAHSGSVYFTANDLDGAWDSSGATVITLLGDSAEVSGSGAYAYDGNVVISGAGRFVLSGSLTDGSVIVDAHANSKVWLLLDGAELNCSDDACLRIDQADKVFLTLAEGSVNRMTGPVVFSAEAESDGTDGVIYAHDDLTINGSGSLSVTAHYLHGIVAKDDLVITGGTIDIKAQADAIRANDSLRICSASLSMEANDDGISVREPGGYLYIESGSFAITAEDDAVKSVGALTVAGGDFTVDSVGDAFSSDTAVSIEGGTIEVQSCYEGVEAPLISLSGGDLTIYARDDGFNASASLTSTGLPQVLISGGALTIVNATATDADGIDSNGDILVSGGTVRISLVNSGTNSALDCNTEGGGVCRISGGSVIACGSYAMAGSFDAESEQCSVLYNFASGAEAGTAVSMEDEGGVELLRWEVPCSFSSAVLSVPELQLGETYLMVIGEDMQAITLDEVSASYGSGQSGGFGGSMNWGAMQPREDFGGFPEEASDGDMPSPPADGEDRPEPPDGEIPEPPEDGFDGEAPDMSEMPSPPGSDGGQMPEPASGETQAQLPAASSADAEAEDAPQPVSAEVWLLLGAVVLVLALGILFGAKFEPKE